MRHDWEPRHATMRGFEVAQIPTEAARALVRRAVQHFAADQTIRKTDEVWNQIVIRWVNSDWSDPKKKAALMRSLREQPQGGNGASQYEDDGSLDRALAAAGVPT